ncbi:lysine-2,3-aminomutase-like protein [Archangium violaceum]|uniref:lysine-2,3-aminomutase-like protein n=1 Tax=Archangium violaceum TaxID=83451 RepID=UPI001EF052AC|nr:lysine-2,3-aminomutase-like protein [Archangium violaceum]
MPVRQYPDFLLTDYEKILADSLRFKAAGGSAIVEMSPIDWGRDATRLVELARATGLHIIAATGFHKVTYYSDIHWIYAYSEEDIARLVCEELEVGMDAHNYNGPLVLRTDARAGVIKVGTRSGRFSDIELKLLRVAAMAHLKTGAPIITHTDEGQLALEQITFLMQQGVKPSRIALSHMDRRIDIGYHKEVASTGAFLEYDALTRVGKGFDKSTLQLVLGMAEEGYAKNLLLGGDISRQGYWRSYGGEPGLDFLVGDFRSALSKAGLPQETLDSIYVHNPRAFLTWGRSTAAGHGDDAGAGGRRDTLRESEGQAASGRRIRTVAALVARNMVVPEDQPALEAVASRFSIAVTPSIAEQIKGLAGNDPIGRQFVPSPAELRVDERELADPIGDKVHSRTRAIIHRHPDRVLLKPTHVCPVYCRFCFRREAVGQAAEPIGKADLGEALEYIQSQRQVWEVILTGGDPFILSDRRLQELFSALHAINHVEVIRVHTRYPVAEPQRITHQLAQVLKGRAAVYVVIHCNHPRELTDEVRAACSRLIDQGIPMLSQTVLLRGVNDEPETMEELMRALVRARIKPYYLHHLDMARGTGHFRTTVAKGQDIMRRLRGRVSGLCQPTYVLDIPGGHGKVPIGPVYIRPAPGGTGYAVEDYEGRQQGYTDLADGSPGSPHLIAVQP